MRPIKFRAWTGEQMVSPDYVCRDGFAHWLEDSIPCSTDKVMQFTGLHDKNGVEIYEGDILDFDPKEWGTEKPVYDVVSMEKIVGNWSMHGSLDDLRSWRKVIGNIYQNPELLEDTCES